MKSKFLTLSVIAISSTLFLGGCGSTEPQGEAGIERPFLIGLAQLSEHTALDQSRIGFEAAISDFVEETGMLVEIDFQNAQGDIATLSTIAQRFVNNNVDVIHSIATATTLAMAQETSIIPIVGGSISDYISPGFAISNEAPGHNITGTSALMPIERQIHMLLEFLPETQVIGIGFSSSEPNAVFQAGVAREIIEGLGLTVIEGTVTNVNDISQVLTNLANQVDALWIPTDNNFATAFDLVVQISRETNTPLFNSDSVFTMRGAFAGLGIEWYALGRMAAAQVIDILLDRGEPSTMPIHFPTEFSYVVNREAIEFFGITVPERFVDYIQ